MKSTEEGKQNFQNIYYPKKTLVNYRIGTAEDLPTVEEIRNSIGLQPYYSTLTSHEQMIIIGGMCIGKTSNWNETTQT